MGSNENLDKGLSEKEIVKRADKALEQLAKVRTEVGQVIFGQESVVERTIVSVLSGGHVLLVGVRRHSVF